MGMSGGGSNSGNKKRSRIVMSEINVTPLVDVMLVLLIIFMVTAPMLQQGLEIDLPETKNSGVETVEDPFVLMIHRNKKIYADKTELSLKTLATKLNAIFKTRKNKQVYIKADRHVEYGTVAETMAEVRAAGITNISLITLPKP